MLVSIMIPTLKLENQVIPLIKEITSCLQYNPGFEYEVKASCMKQSASRNRNWCIDNANGEIIIQIDDDVHVVQKDWIIKLISPLIEHKDKISIIAPRLTDANLNPAPQLGNNGWYDIIPDSGLKVATHTPETKLNVVCSACISFFKEGCVRFDNNFAHACFEDTDFCMTTNKAYPDKKIIINENSKLHHLNEGKWRVGGTWAQNRLYFNSKWETSL